MAPWGWSLLETAWLTQTFTWSAIFSVCRRFSIELIILFDLGKYRADLEGECRFFLKRKILSYRDSKEKFKRSFIKYSVIKAKVTC